MKPVGCSDASLGCYDKNTTLEPAGDFFLAMKKGFFLKKSLETLLHHFWATAMVAFAPASVASHGCMRQKDDKTLKKITALDKSGTYFINGNFTVTTTGARSGF
jgi:hypothetical protein